MKQLFIVIALLTCQGAFCQNPTPYNQQQLSTLAKVWGLLKYYHPAVSQGKLDWDAVLIKSFQPGHQSLQTTVQQWLDTANKTSFNLIPASVIACDSVSLKNFNTSWISSSKLLSARQKSELNKLVNHPENIGTYWSFNNNSHHTYGTAHEKTYKENSQNYRLLNLFRNWNIIEYFYPYKYLLSKRWTDVLSTYIPLFSNAADSLSYKRAITRFSAEINDSHSNITPTFNYDLFGNYAAPFNTLVIDQKAIVTKLVDADICKAVNIELGDVIETVNGQAISAIIDQNKQFIPASNLSVVNREAYNYLFSGKDSVMTIAGKKKNGAVFNQPVKRIQRVFLNEWDHTGIPSYDFTYQGKKQKLVYFDEQKKEIVSSGIIDNIGFIDFSLLQVKKIDSVMKAMQKTRGIVFDLRGYNTDGNVIKALYYLLPRPVFFGISTQPIFSSPGKFCYIDYIISRDYKYLGKENPDYYKGKVVVLINENTQSAEELLAMIFKCVPNVVFAGSQTAGADGNKTAITLTDGRELEFSGLGIYYPDGKQTQRIGIVPDIVIKPTLKNVQDNQDILVENAFRLINQL